MTSRNEERRNLLAQQEFFAGLEARDLDELIAASRVEKIAARHELYNKGAEAHQIYLVLAGRLKVATSSPDGEDHLPVARKAPRHAPEDVRGEVLDLDPRHDQESSVVGEEANVFPSRLL